MNILIGAVGLIATIIIGAKFGNKYKQKYMLFNDFCTFLETISAKLQFTQPKVQALVQNFDSKSHFRDILQEYIEKGNIKSWCEKSKNIEPENIAILQKFFDEFGTADCDTELDKVKTTLAQSQMIKQNYYETYKSKGTMYSKLGVMCGLAVFIVLL